MRADSWEGGEDLEGDERREIDQNILHEKILSIKNNHPTSPPRKINIMIQRKPSLCEPSVRLKGTGPTPSREASLTQ